MDYSCFYLEAGASLRAIDNEVVFSNLIRAAATILSVGMNGVYKKVACGNCREDSVPSYLSSMRVPQDLVQIIITIIVVG